MRALNEADLGTSRTFDTGGLADQLERQRKKRRYAYPAWLCLGSHYLYLGRPVVQALFWLTGGGLLVWWLVDLFRIPALVDRHNRRTVDALFRDWQLGIERRLRDAAAAVARHTYVSPPPAAPPVPLFDDDPWPDEDDPVDAPSPTAPVRRFRAGAAAVLIAIPILLAAISVLAPRPVYPRAVHEPSFRTVRQVNIRALPSTSSAVLAKLEKNVLIRGMVEEVEGRGPSRWLRITRGTHEDRYVALQNLDRR